MQERSEEQIMSRLLELENDGQAERRTGLTGQRFLSLIHDPDTGRAYVLRHGVDSTEGAELPEGEFFEYPNGGVAAQAYDQMLAEARSAGEVAREDSTQVQGDFETGGPESRDSSPGAGGDPLGAEPPIGRPVRP